MSAARRLVLATMLMSCFALALTASAARAQMGGDVPPNRAALAPTEVVDPGTPSAWSDLGSFRMGLPLQFSASLAAYRWLGPMLGQPGSRQAPAMNFAQHDAVRSTWWRKRI